MMLTFCIRIFLLGLQVLMMASARPVSAETIELVTYYPSQANTGDVHVRSLTVGDAYRNQNPGDGQVLIFDRLGIGRLAPRVALDVEGSLMLEDVNGAAVLWFRNTQVNPAVAPGLYIRSDNDPATFEAASERMFIGANGRVGIGTTTPAGPLHVVGVDRQVSSAVFMPGTGAGSQIRVGIGTAAPKPVTLDLRGQMNIEDVNGAGVIYFGNSQVNPAVPVGLYIRSDDDPATFEAASERMFISANGNVGIGTTSPNAAAALEVSSTTQGFLPPRMITTERDAIASVPEGLVIYNTTNHRLEVHTDTSWQPVGGTRTAVSSYVGNGVTGNRNISVGFNPRAVFITDSSRKIQTNKLFFTTDDYAQGPSGFNNALINENVNTLFEELTLTASGFRVKGAGLLNMDGRRYYYVALE